MKLSIVTPSFNQGQYLGQTIASVLASTRLPDEYFVIDGGSGDNSVEVIRAYEGKLTSWRSEKDRGQADAINKGLKMASGDILGWLNSDDIILPGAYEAVIAAFEQYPAAAMVYGNAYSIDENGQTINLQKFAPYTLTDMMAFKIICQPAVFFRRSALQKAGLLDESYHYLLDHHLWLRLAQHGEMIYLPQTLAAARYHPAAKNVAHTNRFGEEAFRIIDWMQGDPNLASLYSQYEKQVKSGAYRLDGYYLMEGRDHWGGLRAYAKAIMEQPSVVSKELPHILYGLLGLLHLGGIKTLYKRLRKKSYQQDRIN